MAKQTPEDVERRLDAGDWLQIGDLMILFGATRSMVDRWMNDGVRMVGPERMVIRYRVRLGGVRECHPGDVSALLVESRKIRSADDPLGETGLTAD